MGPSASAGMNVSAPRIRITPTSRPTNSIDSVGSVPAPGGTLPTDGPLFVGLLVGVILIMAALLYFPAQALGPIVEHFMVLDVVAKQH